MSPANYDGIREENILRYGRETKHLELFSQLYADRTHFIYELLQNAEDADATKIAFKLHRKKIEVCHDGRKFSEDDVRGICGVADATKADDVTKIGRFGIGFKSVFTYSSRPEIRSGSERFAIKNFVRPELIEAEEIPDDWTTVFVLHFDQPKTRKNAYKEIANRLEGLSARTLLFLDSLQEISWEHVSKEGMSKEGMFLRQVETCKGLNRITLLGEAGDKTTEDESWLVYSKNLKAKENVKPVQIGWRLAGDKKSIVPFKNSCLFSFFPTELETHLGMAIQGPFVTTPARDNVPVGNDWNSLVISQAADLLVDTLRSLKKMRLLNVTVLECLPIQPRHFESDSRFYALAQATRKALTEEDLLPGIDDGSFIAAGNAVLGRSADLREVISPSQLTRIYGLSPVSQWLDGSITENTARALRKYLLEQLKITEIDGIGFARRVDDKFFEDQSDQWLTQFYGYLSEQPALWRVDRPLGSWRVDWQPGPLRERKYIRLEDGSHETPFKKDGTPQVFLPGNSTAVLCIKSAFASDKRCNQFFQKLGLAQPDEATAFTQTVLPSYSHADELKKEKERRPKQVPLEAHLGHIESLLSLIENCEPSRTKSLITSCAERYFLLSDNDETRELAFQKPEQLYSRSDKLNLYFAGLSGIQFLSRSYGKLAIELTKAFKIKTKVFVCQEQPGPHGYVIITKGRGKHVRGVAGFNSKFSVYCLDAALSEPNLDRSLLIWNEFVLPYKKQIYGKVQTSNRKKFDFITDESEQYSKFGKALISHAWIPDKNGKFKKPSEINAEDIDSRIRGVELVAASLGIKGAKLVSMANSLGIEPSDVELIKQLKSNPREYQRVKNILKSRPEFPVQEPSNPERRGQVLKKRIEQAPKVNRERRERTVRTTYNKGQIRDDLEAIYTNDNGELVCQICKNTMPFKKRDGAWYFEAVQLLKDPDLELDAITSIALCPICSARFKEYVQGTDQQETLPVQLTEAKDSTVEVHLDNGVDTIRFTGKHISDLKIAIESAKND